jgi:uridine kinase
MGLYILVSGLLRNFTQVLFPFLCELAEKTPLQLIVCTSKQRFDSKFSGDLTTDEQLQCIVKESFCRLCIVDNIELEDIAHLSQRENTIYQWYHIQTCFESLARAPVPPQPTDVIVRMRPDIRPAFTVDEFLQEILRVGGGSGGQSTIHVPTGNDIFHTDFLSFANSPLNDQFAIGQYTAMKIYGDLFSQTQFNALKQPIISEQLLADHLAQHSIHVERINLPYSLCLSSCHMVGITGDSGVGKTTLTNALRKVFPFDSNLLVETDRYHKWERGAEEWKRVTHLNPAANFLEKMTDDTYLLKMGEQIEHVDYDHTTGKFTDLEYIDSKPFVFLCGLHTLYNEEIRSNYDLKIFIDADYSLKRFWKLQRDMSKRGYSFERAEQIFQSRQADYQKFVLPQKDYATLIVQYFPLTPVPEVFTIETAVPSIGMTVSIHRNIETPYIQRLLKAVSKRGVDRGEMVEYTVHPHWKSAALATLVPEEYHPYIQPETIYDSYLGILQILSVLYFIEASPSKQSYTDVS